MSRATSTALSVFAILLFCSLASSITIRYPPSLAGTHINSPLVNPKIYHYYPAYGPFSLQLPSFHISPISVPMNRLFFILYFLSGCFSVLPWTSCSFLETRAVSCVLACFPFGGNLRNAITFPFHLC